MVVIIVPRRKEARATRDDVGDRRRRLDDRGLKAAPPQRIKTMVCAGPVQAPPVRSPLSTARAEFSLSPSIAPVTWKVACVSVMIRPGPPSFTLHLERVYELIPEELCYPLHVTVKVRR